MFSKDLLKFSLKVTFPAFWSGSGSLYEILHRRLDGMRTFFDFDFDFDF